MRLKPIRVNNHHNVIPGNRYDPKVLGCSKWTLFQAAKSGDIQQLDRCIADNIDLGLKGADERTALHIAVANRQKKFVQYLLGKRIDCMNKGADLDIQGLNALHICVINGDAEIYLLLQSAGFDTEITTKDGKTILDLATENRHRHLCDVIAMTQNVQEQGLLCPKWTELHHCAVNGSAVECCWLIKQFPEDVDVEVDTNNHPFPNLLLPKYSRMTPLELALHSENISVLEILAKNSSFTTIERCLDGIRSISAKEVLVQGIVTQLLESHKDVQHGKLIGTGEDVLVIYTTDQLDKVRPKIAGMKTIYKNTSGFDQDNERAIDFEMDMAEPGLSKKENELMKYVIAANSDTLWRNHKNLNAIRISAVRTTGGKAFRHNCIVLCCKFKGFLLKNEEKFPPFLSRDGLSFSVDVREEHTVLLTSQSSDKLEPLACGGAITGSCAQNKVCGTIGPFVELPNEETGFLTCAHVIDNNPAFGVQTGYNDLVYQPKKGSSADCLCGEVVQMAFRPSAYPSIDAALVKITSNLRIPRSINFVSSQQGIADGMTFNTGSIGNYLPSSSVLKFGAFTPKLECNCSATGHEEKIEYPQGKVVMKGLTKILCRVHHQKGDSGAGVFVKNDEGNLECVGLFFAGRGREGYFIPIKDVLTHCGDYNLKSYL